MTFRAWLTTTVGFLLASLASAWTIGWLATWLDQHPWNTDPWFNAFRAVLSLTMFLAAIGGAVSVVAFAGLIVVSLIDPPFRS